MRMESIALCKLSSDPAIEHGSTLKYCTHAQNQRVATTHFTRNIDVPTLPVSYGSSTQVACQIGPNCFYVCQAYSKCHSKLSYFFSTF